MDLTIITLFGAKSRLDRNLIMNFNKVMQYLARIYDTIHTMTSADHFRLVQANSKEEASQKLTYWCERNLTEPGDCHWEIMEEIN